MNTEEDRKAIQDEIDQLNKEIDHIAYDTNFNQNYMLAEGTPKAKPGFFYVQTGSLAEQSIIINFVNASKESLGVDKVDVSNHEKASDRSPWCRMRLRKQQDGETILEQSGSS